MFKPSQQQFPIQPTPNPEPTSLVCWDCRSTISTSPKRHPKQPPYRIRSGYHGPYLEMACSFCQCWTNFRYRDVCTTVLNAFYLPQNKSEWNQVRQHCFSTYPPHIAQHIYKHLRQERFDSMNNYNWRSYFTDGEVRWLEKQIAELTKDEPCVDNVRVAKVGKSRQVKRYWKQKDKGCCGSKDVRHFRFWTMTEYMIGFNYGH